MRGRDWIWQEQDGGAGNTGILGDHIEDSGWVEVTWQNGNVREYRVTDRFRPLFLLCACYICSFSADTQHNRKHASVCVSLACVKLCFVTSESYLLD